MKSFCRVPAAVAGCATAMLTLGPIATLSAQEEGAAPQAKAEAKVEEIVVTTRKRAENLQEVPLAITAFGTDELEKRSIQSLSDVALQTPGLSFESYSTGVYGTPVIRGLAQTDITSPLPNVSTFVDGIYLQRPYSVDLGVFDVERIEVVKGPQSALYGKNAFAGVINYVTRRPKNKWAASGSLTFGSGDRRDITGRLDAPIGEWGGISVTMGHTEFDGTWRNNYPGVESINPALAKVGGYDNKSWGVALDLTPLEGTKLSMAYYNLDKHSEVGGNYFRPSQDLNNATTGNCGPPTAPTRFICGQLSTNPLTYASPTSRRLPGVDLEPEAQFTNTKTSIFRVNLTQELGKDFTLGYNFGYVSAEAFSIAGGDWDPVHPALTLVDTVNFAKGPAGRNTFNTHELRVDWQPQSRFSGSFGISYSRTADRSVGENLFLPLGTPLSTINVGDATTLSSGLTQGLGGSATEPVQFVLEDGRGRDETHAVFGALSWKVLDEYLRLGVEARYASENRKAAWQVFSAQTGGLVPFSGDKTYYQFTPRFTVDSAITDDNRLYASAAQGIKSGGFNFAAALPEEQTFNSESNWTYEIGSKNQFLDRRLTVNVAIFYVDWSDLIIRIQSTPPPGSSLSGSISQNIGSATSYGIELDGAWHVIDSLTLNYGASWDKPEFKKGTRGYRAEGLCYPDNNGDGVPDGNAPCLLVAGIPGAPGNAGKDYTPLGGHTLPRTPTYNGTLGLQWNGSIPWGDVFVRGDVVHQSKEYAEEFNLAVIQSRTLLNASAGFSRSTWRLQLWAKNLLDKEYVSNSFFIYIPNLGSATYVPSLGEKRTFGVTAYVDF